MGGGAEGSESGAEGAAKNFRREETGYTRFVRERSRYRTLREENPTKNHKLFAYIKKF